MSEEIFDPVYWQRRMLKATEQHHAVFRCPKVKWDAIAEKHKSILAKHINPTDSVLDVGCGWGRLLELMPEDWCGDYTGIDLSPDFLRKARATYPKRDFRLMDARDLSSLYKEGLEFDWAILVSIRPMIINYKGIDEWQVVEYNINLLTDRTLFLEYDEKHEGKIE